MKNETNALLFSFPGTSPAQGNVLAASLATDLRVLDPTSVVKRVRETPDSMDFGASLAVILGTAAVTALARGIATWMARNSGVTVEIRRDGHLLLAIKTSTAKTFRN
jgi:hypothetical protein